MKSVSLKIVNGMNRRKERRDNVCTLTGGNVKEKNNRGGITRNDNEHEKQ